MTMVGRASGELGGVCSVIVALTILFCLPAWADENPAPLPAGDEEDEAEGELVGHETIVVVGKRIPEPLSMTARSVSVIGPEELAERSPRTVPEALWDAPGVFVQETNYGGGSPIIRGLIGPQNLILVDGVRLNNSVYRSGPLQYLNLVDPQSLQRIEVLRGAGSVLYGSDAMGGVIQVVPLTPRRSLRGSCPEGGGSALLRYSSADQGRVAHLHLDGGYGDLSALAGVTYKKFYDLTGGRGIGEQLYSGYDDVSAMGSVVYRFPAGTLSGWRLSASYLGTRITDAGRTDKLYDKQSLQVYDNDDHLAYARLEARVDRLRTKAEATVSYQSFFERKDTIAVAEDLRTHESAVRDDTFVDTLGLDLQLVSSLVPERLWVQYGGMFYRDWVDAEQTTREPGSPWRPSDIASYPSGSRYDNFGGFLLLEGDAWSRRDEHTVRVAGGYRLHGMSGYAPPRAALPRVEIEQVGHVFFGSVQYLHQENENLALSIAQGFRAPNLNEAVMLGDTGKFFHVPNGDLGPERSDTVEISGQGRAWRLTAGLAAYVSLLHDLIKREDTTWEGQPEIGGKPVAWNVNGGEGLLWGVEPRLAADLGSGVTLSGAVTFTWGEETIEGAPDQPLTRIPPLFGQLGLRYERRGVGSGRLFAEGYVRAAAEQDRLSAEDEADARIPPGGTPGWRTLNLRLGYATSRASVTLAVENLANDAYKYHGSGVYAPGTNAMLTVEAHR